MGGAPAWSLLDAVQAPARQSGSLQVTNHRPWPLPETSWVMGQTWEELLFAHWRAPANALRSQLPDGLELDLFEDEAWIGITPFRVTGLRARGLPPLPLLSSFLEVNMRTYVTAGGKPGIWFFSLDASSELAVEAARRVYKLPYFRAAMRAEWRDGRLEYASRRRDPRGAPAAFRTGYRAIGDVLEPDPASDNLLLGARSLAHFLTERYCLYTEDGGRLKRAEIHHAPWPLQPAEAHIEENTMSASGIELLGEDPLLYYSARQDVVIWPLEDA